MKLNLGCGNKHLPGYINIDFPDNYAGRTPDVVCDVKKLPYEAETADEVCAIHLIEHFYLWEAPEVLKEWARVLKPGGRLVLELPCLDKVLPFFNADPIDARMTLFAFHGDPRYRDPRMCHRWCYSRAHMKSLMLAECRQVTEELPQFHVPKRDMRLIGIK